MIVLFVVKNNLRIHGGLNSEKKFVVKQRKKKRYLVPLEVKASLGDNCKPFPIG